MFPRCLILLFLFGNVAKGELSFYTNTPDEVIAVLDISYNIKVSYEKIFYFKMSNQKYLLFPLQ